MSAADRSETDRSPAGRFPDGPGAPPRIAPRRTTGGPLTEAGAAAVALAAALVAVAHCCMTARAWILFSDADSVLLPLMRASRAVGEPQRWALSPVLFLPERALYDLTAATGAGVRDALAIDAVVTLVVLYGVLRAVAALAGARTPFGAVLAFGAFCGLTLLDSSAVFDSFELPSLTMTTTYYSATLLGAALAVGLTAAALGHGRRRWAGAALALLTAGSVLTNPLFVLWGAAPILITTALLTAVRVSRLADAAAVGTATAIGTALGLVGRIPFAAEIARGTGAYLDPVHAPPALAYLLHDLLARAGTPAGLVSIVVVDAAIVLDVFLGIRAAVTRRTAAAVLLATGAIGPIVVLAGTVVAGTAAARYLQPMVLLPLVPLVLVEPPRRLDVVLRSRTTRAVGAAAVVAAAIAGGGITAAVASTPDPSIACVDAWIDRSGETGAGTFTTIRGPKALLPDPRRLLQVDRRLRAVPWLTDLADYDRPAVSFLVVGPTDPPFRTGAAGTPRTTTTCGRYRILDWRAPVLHVTTGGPIEPPLAPAP